MTSGSMITCSCSRANQVRALPARLRHTRATIWRRRRRAPINPGLLRGRANSLLSGTDKLPPGKARCMRVSRARTGLDQCSSFLASETYPTNALVLFFQRTVGQSRMSCTSLHPRPSPHLLISGRHAHETLLCIAFYESVGHARQAVFERIPSVKSMRTARGHKTHAWLTDKLLTLHCILCLVCLSVAGMGIAWLT